ncbi:MAG: c-type cytochrome, partial [Magnetospirillum sp.]|nr:c-type cytochrome [Magnetospirillum sp.]
SESDPRKVTAFMREAFMLPAPTADATRGRAIFAKTCSVCHGERGDGASWAKGSLNPSPFDFTSAKAKELSRRHMINTVTYGSPKTAMMGFSTQLNREDISAVVDYVRDTFVFPQGSPENENAPGDNLSYGNRMLNSKGHAGHGGGKHAEHGMSGPIDMSEPLPNGLAGDAAAGKQFFNNNCFTCHGKEGKGDGPRAYFIQPKPANLTSDDSRSSLNRPHLFKSISMGSNGSEMPAWSKVLSDQEIANVAEYVFTTFIRPPTETPAASAEPAQAAPSAGPEQKKNRE